MAVVLCLWGFYNYVIYEIFIFEKLKSVISKNFNVEKNDIYMDSNWADFGVYYIDIFDMLDENINRGYI